MNDFIELVGQAIGILLALIIVGLMLYLVLAMIALIFAAPGFVILALIGYEGIGFWNSAVAGLGTMMIVAMVLGKIYGE
jgi:hypothetical protein